jgi:hypothetical protein
LLEYDAKVDAVRKYERERAIYVNESKSQINVVTDLEWNLNDVVKSANRSVDQVMHLFLNLNYPYRYHSPFISQPRWETQN